ncbi:Fcf2-domain-containing protein [Cylindrobasidium torrendii FP15055 ss-10]|uniref:Fcf2-domain-containing protein n=1 Tax=Cylindrobasidium torrendii FP15055 ss-10 TaxID=1314674 RepID=A0A0D7B950_9AGAR|nr:Fcf2-domain-containing protein [Cylindrobasidium torrendii FP15055 ss-10]
MAIRASIQEKDREEGPSSPARITESESDSESSSSSTSDSDLEDESEDEITQEYLDSLLEKARQNAGTSISGLLHDDITKLDDDVEKDLPRPNPGKLPAPYFELDKTNRHGKLKNIRDPDIERLQQDVDSNATPAPPIGPPELMRSGKPLTKKEIKAAKKVTAGAGWFDMPAPAAADLPRLHREVEAMRLHNQLDPKRFYRKDEGEGKGIKGLPKFFQIGTVVSEKMPFGGASSGNLTRAERKRTLVDELVDDAEAKRYAKRKFNELQSVRGAKGKNTLKAKQKRMKF